MHLIDNIEKNLILIRHGKSSWEFDVTDRERPLKPRGVSDICLVAKRFMDFGYDPDSVYSSPAKRALDTAILFTEQALIGSKCIAIKEELYDFSGINVLNFVKSLPNSEQKIIIFGHNHAFTSISNTFGNKIIDNVPTSGLVHLRFEIQSWKELHKGKTVKTIFPRDLK